MTDTFNHPQIVTNIPELTVTALSAAIKNTIEDAFGYVRVRGELSRVTIAKSGHLYTSIKDDNAVLDGVCWKGTLARMQIKPEEGLEVICTGRITTYPGRSNYQLVIENMELAGMGAILKMLEARKAKLAAEGLFDAARKKPLPFLPKTIGVVTSPTGAVIRDILHRVSDRFPVHVVVWPVNVQGDRAAPEIIRGINGFNAMPEGTRPDVIIVARGGGSFEDLMPFNDEALVRAAAASAIPLISAVGHETDVTLIDYAADKRAPTPTAAAEMAVPVRANLMAQVLDDEQHLMQSLLGRLNQAQMRLDTYTRTFTRPQMLLDAPSQRLDRAAMTMDRQFEKMMHGFETRLMQRASALRTPHEVINQKADTLLNVSDGAARAMSSMLDMLDQRVAHAATTADRQFEKMLHGFETRLIQRAAALRTPREVITQKAGHLQNLTERATRAAATMLDTPEKSVASLARILESLSFKSALARGYAVIRNDAGELVASAASLQSGDSVTMTFADGTRKAAIEGDDTL